uniref:Bloodthirsty-related gene family, member 30 n=1 Tax=Hippocampus comes TaxID=109280 RepID=A0A3Q2YIT2_HIPCM
MYILWPGNKMAEAAMAPDLFTEQELTCSICLDLFTDPVSTPCGHNFCQACIGGYWASTTTCTCPLCKYAFEERPQLSINKVFAVITENYKISRYGNATDVIWCDVCTGIKQPAVSSCLTCTAAYCAEHVRPHHNTPFYAKHPLMDPQQALRGRTCSLHRRLLEVFCRTCQRCICAICVLEDHRTHQTVSVQTERLSKQVLETLLDEAASSLDRLRAQVVGGVQQQMGAVLARGEGQVSLLEAELGQLTDRRAQLETQAVSQDHIGFLQVVRELGSAFVSIDEAHGGALRSPWSSDDVTLNPMTAYPFLILSEDRKQVKRGEKLQFYRNSQHRFDVWSCITAKEGYATGRHYWEVCNSVTNKDWKLGVATESAQRKGLFDMSPSNGYFALWWSGSQLRALTAPPLTKMGVFLDVEAGQVSFYNAKSGSEIFSFNCGEFTEQMFPLFGTGDKEVPLIILT